MSKRQVNIEHGKLEEILAVAFAPVVALSELIKNASDSCVKKNDCIRVDIDTLNGKIHIKDNGHGFSIEDIDNLNIIGFSSKMKGGNNLTRIGEPFAGSKGLGILTAFNLCSLLEIKTFSEKEQKAYHLLWEKGSGEIIVDDCNEDFIGTELILNNVNKDDIEMIIDEDELSKLHASSFTFYKNSLTLPSVEIYANGVLLSNDSTCKIEELYQGNKKKVGNRGYFSAKGSFTYSKNTVVLNYDENVKRLFDLKDSKIDLSDDVSLRNFLKNNKITLHKASDVYLKMRKFASVDLDDFTGEIYVWKGAKHNGFAYPHGVKVYANNYGLYRYLDSENDWLHLSQISQNRKNTDYKLKNAYGYVHFNNFVEENSELKISNERNDFKVNLSQKKFMFIMRDIILNIFATIDIAQRNYDEGVIFQSKATSKVFYEDEEFSFKDLIKTSLTFSDVGLELDDMSVILDQSNGIFKGKKKGKHKAIFNYEDKVIEVEFEIKSRIPNFDIRTKIPALRVGVTYNLSEFITKSSLKHVAIDEIDIHSDDAKILKGCILSKENPPGSYEIQYGCEKFGVEISKTAQISIELPKSDKSAKIINLYSKIVKYPKLNDIVRGIAESYVFNPNFAMISVRTLIEGTLKAFIEEFYEEGEAKKLLEPQNFAIEAAMNGLFNNLANNKLNHINDKVLIAYKRSLIDSRKSITDHYKSRKLNSFVHGHKSYATEAMVYKTMELFSPMVNFVFNSINAKCPPDAGM